jgi:hypothetical protein
MGQIVTFRAFFAAILSRRATFAAVKNGLWCAFLPEDTDPVEPRRSRNLIRGVGFYSDYSNG